MICKIACECLNEEHLYHVFWATWALVTFICILLFVISMVLINKKRKDNKNKD